MIKLITIIVILSTCSQLTHGFIEGLYCGKENCYDGKLFCFSILCLYFILLFIY